MNDNCNHKVRIKTANLPITDITGRIGEINRLREWLSEITEWQPNVYTLKIHSSGQIIDIWFADEDAAILCRLKWA